MCGPTFRHLIRRMVLVAGTAIALSGCVAYPYGTPNYGYAYGYGGAVVAPTVVAAPGYRPWGYGWHRW